MKKNIFLILVLFLLNSHESFATGIISISPIDSYYSPTYSVNFKWNQALDITNYRILIATDASFNNLIKDTSVVYNQNGVIVNINSNYSSVYWKIISVGNIFTTSDTYLLNFINPIQNSNILLWLKADGNVVTDGSGNVTNWNNSITNNLNALQPNSIYQPKLITNNIRLAGNKTISFDGIDDQLAIPNGATIGSTYILLNWQGTGSSFPDYNAVFTRQETSPAWSIIFGAEGGTTSLYKGYYSFRTYINNILGSIMTPLNDFKIISGNRSGLILNYFDNFTIGKDGGSCNNCRCWNGEIAEIICTSTESSFESDSIYTYLYNKYAPPVSLGQDIIAGNSFADTVTLFSQDRFQTYNWSNGSDKYFSKVTTAGTYTLTAKDIFGRTSTDEIKVYPYKRLNNATYYICPGDSIIVNLGISNPYTFNWSDGSTNSRITIKSSGIYTVSIKDVNGIIVKDTINVIVDKPNVNPSSQAGNLTMCFGEKIYIEAPSNFDSIIWSTGSSDNNITINTPGTYTVFAQTSAGCVLNKSFNVNIAGQAPTANFTNSSICQNASAHFSDLSTPPSGDVITSWKWNFSNGNLTSIQNPNTIFSNLGTVSAALKVTTNRGCTDSIFKTYNVLKRPTAGFYNLLACSGNPTTFVDTSRAGSGTISTRFWDFATLGNSNNTTPIFYFPDVATYNVFLQVSNTNGCTDTITRPVYINPSPVSNFTFDSVCVGTYTSFKYIPTIQSPFSINLFNWNFGDGNQNNSVKNVTHTYANPGTYPVQLYVQASNQCVDTVEKQVKVYEPVNIDFTASASQCVGKNIQFTDISTSQGLPISNWNWFFAGQGTSSLQNPTHAFSSQGNYVVQLTASNSIGCVGTKQRSIAVSDVPKPDFTFSPNFGLPPLVVSYNNLSSTSGSYIWNYGDGALSVTGYNPPSHTYTAIGSYPITLISTNYRGCTDSLVKYILVDQAFVDGVMVSVRLIPDGDFYKVEVTIQNNSNIELTQMGLSLQLGNGSVIRENWTGSIMPSQLTTYTFAGEIKIGNNSSIPIVCTTIDNVNFSTPETRTDNNTTCKELAVSNFEVLTAYPNPADERITFGVMLPRDGKVSILFIDQLGQIEYKKEFAGQKGYNSLEMTTMPLNASVYVAEITYEDNLLYYKFAKRNKK